MNVSNWLDSEADTYAKSFEIYPTTVKIDLEEELVQILSAKIAYEIDNEILNDLINIAGTK